ncbi:hypothetical protein KCU81_g8828, partial [Aureobasidium melanogenum]|uniref:Uncharacterized protein n=1 Tax=Aureobasidium melanogenum (strain CBS 110374) TaxID=1043003 RepID=A0A074VDP5_AURM1
MAAGIPKSTFLGTSAELSLEYLGSVDRVVTNFLCTWYHAFPAWRRPKYCAQILSDLQAHLEKFFELEYYFKETQILQAVIKRWGQERHSDAILNWLHAEFLLRVQEAAWHHSTTSSEVTLLSDKITRLMEELEKSTLAPSFDYNSREKHEAPVVLRTFPDEDPRSSTNCVQESAKGIENGAEEKFHQLYAKSEEYAARIHALESIVSGLLSNASTSSIEASISAQVENGQESSGAPGESSEALTVTMPTPAPTTRSSSPIQDPQQRWPTVVLCVKDHHTNMLVRLGCDLPFGGFRRSLRRPDSDFIELWHGNTQIMDEDTPNSLGLEENSLINIVVPVHRSDWVDVSKMYSRNTLAV